MEKIKKIESEAQSSSLCNIKEDALSQVLGQDNSGRLRAMGRNASLSKVAMANVKDKQVVQCQNRITELEQLVHSLLKNQSQFDRQGKQSAREHNLPQMSKNSQIGVHCDLLHWDDNDEVVAKGRIMSNDPNEIFDEVPLGPNAMKVLIVRQIKLDAFLWRPAPGLIRIEDAKDKMVTWPANRVVRTVENFEKADMSKSNDTKTKCNLYDWGGSGELVAEGRVYSNDPNQLINGLPLGPNAMIVWVDDPKKQDAFLWRPVVGMTYIGEVVGKKIAWPESKLVVEKVNITTSSTSMIDDATFHMRTKSVENTRCNLIDVHGSGKIVAEGSVSSSDPNDLVHGVPLGKNALRVWVEIVKIGDAPLWRPSSFMESISDAFGSMVAWPAMYVKMHPVSGPD